MNKEYLCGSVYIKPNGDEHEVKQFHFRNWKQEGIDAIGTEQF